MTEFTLHFGLMTKDLKIVTEADWVRWIKFSINPRFDSYTIVDGRGYYKGQGENCKIVTIIVDGNALDLEYAEHNIKDICHEYCAIHNQEAVLVTKKTVEVQNYGRPELV